MRPLKLSPTISTPDYGDVPQDPKTLEMLQKRSSANIVEGYTITKDIQDQPYSLYAEININNDRLWELVKSLLMNFPDEIALIYQDIDDEDAKYGEYTDKFELINILGRYERELVQDGYLHFGLISHTESKLQEVFIHRTKYLQYWGLDELTFRNLMNQFELYEVRDLNFIDEFPVQTVVLEVIDPTLRPTKEILDDFERLFGNEQGL